MKARTLHDRWVITGRAHGGSGPDHCINTDTSLGQKKSVHSVRTDGDRKTGQRGTLHALQLDTERAAATGL